MPNPEYIRLDDNGLLYVFTLLKGEIDSAGEDNVIEIIKKNGVVLSIGADKSVDIPVPNVSFNVSGNTYLADISDPNGSQHVYIETVVEGDTARIDVDGIEAILPTTDYVTSQGYQTEAQVQALIDAELADITGIDFQVVATLPSTGVKGVIYLVGASAPYDEYIWIEPTGASPHFEQIGSTSIDLSGYVQDTDMHALTNAEIDAIFNQVFGS